MKLKALVLGAGVGFVLIVQTLQAQQEEAVPAAARDLRAKAESGDAEAQYNWSVILEGGDGVPRDEAGSIKWLRKAAEQNYAKAQHELAICYQQGIVTGQMDEAEGVKWFRKAADQNHAEAQFALGSCYQFGMGVARDKAEAAKWYRKAAAQNLVEAQRAMGDCCTFGQGVAKDAVEAATWYRRAAEQNDSEAQFTLGTCYATGQGVAKDGVEAMKWYRKASEQNHTQAQLNLALCYATGQDGVTNYVEAVNLYRKGAERNCAEAQFNLAVCYATGQGVGKDAVVAVEWYRKAAEQNHRQAQYTLAACYATGQGVAKDEMESSKWYRKAGDYGITGWNDLAWVLATSKNRTNRDGAKAVEFAEKAVAATNHRIHSHLDTLAAAYAEAGEFAKAIKTEKEAIALLSPDDDRTGYESRLKLYESNTPYRDELILDAPSLRRALITEPSLSPQAVKTPPAATSK